MGGVILKEGYKILFILLIFIGSTFSGCLSGEIEEHIEPDLILNPMNRETLFFDGAPEINEISQKEYFSSIIQKNKENLEDN